jgi:hypothetical protein
LEPQVIATCIIGENGGEGKFQPQLPFAFFANSGYTVKTSDRRPLAVFKRIEMVSDFMPNSLRHRLIDQLTRDRRHLRDQEQRLARLKYEWSIAKRLRHQASSEDEREKWRVQCDAYMGLVLQQESLIEEIKESIDHCQSRLRELGGRMADKRN